jgi:phosphopantothenoylcysteine synthetase/decarboxylase
VCIGLGPGRGRDDREVRERLTPATGDRGDAQASRPPANTVRLSAARKSCKRGERSRMNVVVTGGGTIAPIDDVRQITNVSSGRFSAMIAESCLKRGASVWHIHAPSAVLPFRRLARFDLEAAEPEREFDRLAKLREEYRAVADRLHLVPLREGTVADYASALRGVLERERIDVGFLAMAVSDYEPTHLPGKLESDAETSTIVARRTPKVIRAVRDWSPEVYLVGFKLLSRSSEAELIRAAEAANRANRADLTIANDLQTLRAGRHTVHLVRNGFAPETLGPSDDLADEVASRVLTWAAESSRRKG